MNTDFNHFFHYAQTYVCHLTFNMWPHYLLYYCRVHCPNPGRLKTINGCGYRCCLVQAYKAASVATAINRKIALSVLHQLSKLDLHASRMSCTAQSHLNHHGFLNDFRLTSACTLLAKNLPLRKYFAQNIMRYVISIKTTANSIHMDL